MASANAYSHQQPRYLYSSCCSLSRRSYSFVCARRLSVLPYFPSIVRSVWDRWSSSWHFDFSSSFRRSNSWFLDWDSVRFCSYYFFCFSIRAVNRIFFSFSTFYLSPVSFFRRLASRLISALLYSSWPIKSSILFRSSNIPERCEMERFVAD